MVFASSEIVPPRIIFASQAASPQASRCESGKTAVAQTLRALKSWGRRSVAILAQANKSPSKRFLGGSFLFLLTVAQGWRSLQLCLRSSSDV